MDQISGDNKISLGELEEEYRKKQKDFLGIGGNKSLLLRFINVRFKRKRLLIQEVVLQDEMRKVIQKIIEENQLTLSRLKEYSHALKTISKKYSGESTHFILVSGSITLIFSAVVGLFKIFFSQLTGYPTILAIAMFFFGLFTLIARIFINETVPIYEELILLIDEYIDSSTD
jgi:hypothetical protein